VRSLRASSYDRSGANKDFLEIGPGETVTLLEADDRQPGEPEAAEPQQVLQLHPSASKARR
jgi:hypothetical protein